MCIIIAKKAGEPLDMDFLEKSIRTSAKRNNDGAGYAIKTPEGNVEFDKGFFNTESFIRAIRNLDIGDDTEFVAHLRYTTAGKTDQHGCHPYVADPTLIRNTSLPKVTAPLVFHNGTFYSYRKTGNDSDTFNFVKDALSKPGAVDMLEEMKTTKNPMLDTILSFNKLAIMRPDNELLLLGDFIYEEGLYMSNTYYKFPWSGKGDVTNAVHLDQLVFSD